MTRPRSVLFVHPSADLYGSDRVLLDLIAGLDRARVAPQVALPRGGPLAERLAALDVPVAVLPVGKLERAQLRGLGPLAASRGVLEAVRAFDRRYTPGSIDLVHTNTLAAVGGAVWARRRGIPHLWHLHEIVDQPTWAARGLSALPGLLARRVVCNSEATRRWLVAERPGLADRAVVLPVAQRRPAPDPEAAAALRARLGLRPEQVLVALVGRISPRKGQTVLVEAARRVTTPDVAFAIAGDPAPGQGEHEEELRRRIATSPRRRAFHLLGFHDDVGTVWEACDLAVVPSRRPESFGLVALEAMAAGKPVVASRTGALPDLVAHERTGLLVPPGDPGALASAVDRLAGDPALRARLGEAGRAAAAARPDPAAVAEHLDRIYESTLDPSAPGARI